MAMAMAIGDGRLAIGDGGLEEEGRAQQGNE
jgi:hypothetical protein